LFDSEESLKFKTDLWNGQSDIVPTLVNKVTDFVLFLVYRVGDVSYVGYIASRRVYRQTTLFGLSSRILLYPDANYFRTS